MLGRFAQVDPLADQYGGLTPYNYAANDPVYFNDPQGLSPNGKAVCSWCNKPRPNDHDYPNAGNDGGDYGSSYGTITNPGIFSDEAWQTVGPQVNEQYNNTSALDGISTYSDGTTTYYDGDGRGNYAKRGEGRANRYTLAYSYKVKVYSDGVESNPYDIKVIGFQDPQYPNSHELEIRFGESFIRDFYIPFRLKFENRIANLNDIVDHIKSFDFTSLTDSKNEFTLRLVLGKVTIENTAGREFSDQIFGFPPFLRLSGLGPDVGKVINPGFREIPFFTDINGNIVRIGILFEILKGD